MAIFSLLTDEQKTELWSCLALKHSRGLGLHSANALMEHYGSALEAVELGRRAPGCWVSEGLVNERAAKAFARESWREKARSEWESLQRLGCQFLYRTHPLYPQLLTEIHDPPLILYYLGDTRLLANPMVGVVGSRNCSEEGILACATLSRQLSSFGVTIVSGLAKGIDRAAHIAGLSSLGSSVAVLGTGIDVVYPESNKDVFQALQGKGLVLSEFASGTVPHAKNFPIRNRIISGLSRGVIIVEAAKRSGSLITARLALEQGRDVFAIPGSNVGKYSEGCHELIRSGAKPVFSAEDVVMDLAPLLVVDVREQLERLKQEETPQSLAKYAVALSSASGLPSLVESRDNPQSRGYRYGGIVRAATRPVGNSAAGFVTEPAGSSLGGYGRIPADSSMDGASYMNDHSQSLLHNQPQKVSQNCHWAHTLPHTPDCTTNQRTVDADGYPYNRGAAISQDIPQGDLATDSATPFPMEANTHKVQRDSSSGASLDTPQVTSSHVTSCRVTSPRVTPSQVSISCPADHENGFGGNTHKAAIGHFDDSKEALAFGQGPQQEFQYGEKEVAQGIGQEYAQGNEVEARLLPLLQDDWRHIDWISEQLGLDSSTVSTTLTLLEVNGVVMQKPGMLYRLS